MAGREEGRDNKKEAASGDGRERLSRERRVGMVHAPHDGFGWMDGPKI